MGKFYKYKSISHLVVVLLRTWDEDIYKFVEKRIYENVTEDVHMNRNSLCERTLEKPWRWIMMNNKEKSTKVLIIVPEGYFKGQTDELYEKIQDAFSDEVKSCYFFKTRDLEEKFCGDALRIRLIERMQVLEKQIRKDLEGS